jgi:UDP-N-acetylmuramate--alanine ligase
MTGVKGTGMAALAEILVGEGARVTGSDVEERFFTDTLLEQIGLVPTIGFSPDHVPQGTEILVYSAAYDARNPERRAAHDRGIPQFSYTEMLGALSQNRPSLAVSGVHGKTTTTALAGSIVRSAAIPATVVVGSAVPSFGGSATLRQGADYLIAETCEYRRHFLDFSPTVVLITSVEADHLDYYRDAEDVREAFTEFCHRLPPGGTVVYCADDRGAVQTVDSVRATRGDLQFLPYGFTVTGDGGVSEPRVDSGTQHFFVTLDGRQTAWTLPVPGRHMVADAAGAVRALAALVGTPHAADLAQWQRGVASFAGTRRRSEILGEEQGILVMDDYAHHPRAISTTLEGYRAFWPGRRLVVDFMSHTYSRTAALLDDFAAAFSAAAVVFLNDIYASARETDRRGVSGEALAGAVSKHHPDVRYVPDFDQARRDILAELRRGDLFVTMGAGDNFRIARHVLEELQSRS